MTMDLEFIGGEVQEGKQELRLWLKLLATTKLISQELRRRLRAEFGATLPQFDLLAQLYREPDGLRLGELSRRTMVTNGNVTGLVERLETDGLIRRVTSGADRRVTVVLLTDEGRAFFGRMADAHEGWIRDLMGDVDPSTIRTLLEDADTLKQSARTHLSGPEEG